MSYIKKGILVILLVIPFLFGLSISGYSVEKGTAVSDPLQFSSIEANLFPSLVGARPAPGGVPHMEVHEEEEKPAPRKYTGLRMTGDIQYMFAWGDEDENEVITRQRAIVNGSSESLESGSTFAEGKRSDSLGFVIRRARLTLEAREFYPNFSARLVFNGVAKGFDTGLLDAYILWRAPSLLGIIRNVDIQMGNQTGAFGKSRSSIISVNIDEASSPGPPSGGGGKTQGLKFGKFDWFNSKLTTEYFVGNTGYSRDIESPQDNYNTNNFMHNVRVWFDPFGKWPLQSIEELDFDHSPFHINVGVGWSGDKETKLRQRESWSTTAKGSVTTKTTLSGTLPTSENAIFPAPHGHTVNLSGGTATSTSTFTGSSSTVNKNISFQFKDTEDDHVRYSVLAVYRGLYFQYDRIYKWSRIQGNWSGAFAGSPKDYDARGEKLSVNYSIPLGGAKFLVPWVQYGWIDYDVEHSAISGQRDQDQVAFGIHYMLNRWDLAIRTQYIHKLSGNIESSGVELNDDTFNIGVQARF